MNRIRTACSVTVVATALLHLGGCKSRHSDQAPDAGANAAPDDEVAREQAKAAAFEAEADRLLGKQSGASTAHAPATPITPITPVAPIKPLAADPMAQTAGFPALGTYNCNYRGQVAPVFDFALLSGSIYRDYDGNRGTYTFDGATKRILFVTGPMKGRSVHQISAVTFQVLDDNGGPTGNYCPHSIRDPNGKRL